MEIMDTATTPSRKRLITRNFTRFFSYPIAVLTLGAALAEPASAAIWTVSRTDDIAVPGTLRDAVNRAVTGDIITFDWNLRFTPIVLNPALGPLLVKRDITIDGDIDGDGTPDITLDGGYATTIIYVDRTTYQRVTLNGLRLVRGYNSTVGGCLKNYTRGQTVFANGTISDCTAVNDGGGIFNYDANLRIENSEISSNTATRGAGIVSFGSKQPFIADSRLVMNHSNRWGGAVYAYGYGTLHIERSLFQSNYALGAGAGVFTHGSSSTMSLDIETSTFVDNFAQGTDTDTDQEGVGGGISTGGGGNAHIVNSTFTANRAGRDGGAMIFRNYGVREVRHSTIAGNLADVGGLGPRFAGNTHPAGGPHQGGGILDYPPATVTLSHVLFADNGRIQLPSEGGLPDDVTGPVISDNFNLFNQTDVQFVAGPLPGDVLGAVAQLMPLGDYGGPTPTLPLQPGSFGVDMGDPMAVPGVNVPATDQRGMPRVQGMGIDIGAVEFY